MNQQNQSEMTMGPPPKEMQKRMGHAPQGWHGLRLLLQVAVLVCLLLLLARPANRQAAVTRDHSAGLVADVRQVAVQLEEKSLPAEAAKAWDAYLRLAPQADDRAEILYRVGKLYLQAEQYSDAITALVRANVAAKDDPRLDAKIGERMVECLRQMGQYGEVDRELSRQVEAGGSDVGRGKVLATMAGENLTEADLDRMIQRLVDRSIAAQGSAVDAATREAMLERFSDPRMRRQVLQQLLQTELFCRRAREPDMQLDQQPEYQQARKFLADNLLANQFLNEQLQRIQPTNVDLNAYYQANLQRYEEPAALEIQWIKLQADEDASQLLADVESAEDFQVLVKQRRAQEGELPAPRRIVKDQPDALFTNVAPLFDLDANQWTTQPIEGQDGQYLVLIEDKSAARTPPLDEIRPRVQRDYMQIKQQELTEQLLHDLMIRYDVKLMPPTNQTSESDDASTQDASTQDASKQDASKQEDADGSADEE